MNSNYFEMLAEYDKNGCICVSSYIVVYHFKLLHVHI